MLPPYGDCPLLAFHFDSDQPCHVNYHFDFCCCRAGAGKRGGPGEPAHCTQGRFWRHQRLCRVCTMPRATCMRSYPAGTGLALFALAFCAAWARSECRSDLAETHQQCVSMCIPQHGASCPPQGGTMQCHAGRRTGLRMAWTGEALATWRRQPVRSGLAWCLSPAASSPANTGTQMPT